MKTKIIFASILLACSSVFAQAPLFPHTVTTSPATSAEQIASFGVSDATSDLFEITNSSQLATQFIPTLWAHQQSDNRFVLRLFASTNTTQDNGTSPLMIFRTELRSALNLNAPTEGNTFPWGIVAANVGTRPLFAWENGNTQLMRIAANGNVTIGTALTPTAYKLAVGGKIIAEELKVKLQSAGWPDYVFGEDYILPTLAEVEKQIKENGHLKNVPSATEIKTNGLEVGEMARIQQEKIEELTLYIIELNKRLEAQDKRMQLLEATINN